MLGSAEIREKFLDFFRSKGHVIVPSAPIVVKDDPSLLFTNAGMNQFKDYFLGNKQAPYPRVADTQKCLRVSGKHNDLEEVGVDTYHHTMFEMLGNWSFGDYFKKEAIAWSWELLTEIYGIPADRLYVTVFGGDAAESLPADEEARLEWKRWIPEDRMLSGSKKDNFWEMGDTGPCGPCTEIHVDCREEAERKKKDGKELVNRDHPQVIEIWNNVFIQFNRNKSGALEPLPMKHVDTGMGFERLVRVLQHKHSNYDTDIFTGTIRAVAKITGNTYQGSGTDKKDIAFRVIADHIRAICFTIADGQLPSNTGAGYVIRRILRRAVRYYYSYLGQQEPLLFQLAGGLAEQFAKVFPELQRQEAFVARVIKEEEETFLRTLDKGIKLFTEYVEREEKETLGRKDPHTIDGKFAFKLNDTYGFPVDLTSLMAREIGWSVDVQGFEKELQEQKDRSRSATRIDTGDWIPVHENGNTLFEGYGRLETDTEVSRYRKIKAKGKEAYQFVLSKTPFYAESGGQVGDTGFLQFAGESIPVLDTRKENGLIVHVADKLPAQVDAPVHAMVDAAKRSRTAVHHTATHLLHAALRKVLGTHVAQKGSLVNDEHLRFDFSHFAKMSDEELASVEALVNEKIRADIPVVIREMPREEALKTGAMALFGEKYGDTVRVVTIDPAFSIELCGGTHVERTGELGSFRIKSESAVAAGVRRIEAVAGPAAEHYISGQLSLLRGMKELLKNPKDPEKSIRDLSAENAALRKQVELLETARVSGIATTLAAQALAYKGASFIGSVLDEVSGEGLRKLAITLRQEIPDLLLVLASVAAGKVQVVVALGDRLLAAGKPDAVKIVREQVAPLIKGGGGGQPSLATAGGQDGSRLKEMIEKVKGLL
jgi:alanyl-tRNA synthetase